MAHWSGSACMLSMMVPTAKLKPATPLSGRLTDTLAAAEVIHRQRMSKKCFGLLSCLWHGYASSQLAAPVCCRTAGCGRPPQFQLWLCQLQGQLQQLHGQLCHLLRFIHDARRQLRCTAAGLCAGHTVCTAAGRRRAVGMCERGGVGPKRNLSALPCRHLQPGTCEQHWQQQQLQQQQMHPVSCRG